MLQSFRVKEGETVEQPNEEITAASVGACFTELLNNHQGCTGDFKAEYASMLEGAAVPSEEDIKAVREEMKAEKKKNRRGSSRRGGNRSRGSRSRGSRRKGRGQRRDR